MASRALGQDLLVGFELGHYRIAEKIGAGGMGEVYRASDEHLARDVAIKVLPPGTLTDESARKHFHKEALVLSQAQLIPASRPSTTSTRSRAWTSW